MSIYLSPIKRGPSRESVHVRGIALVATLALVSIVSLILVAFVTSMRQDRAATFSYSQSLASDQLAKGGLQLVVNELRSELAKDAAPDLGTGNYTNYPIYTNLTSANILPQPNGTNANMSLLVKISTNNPSFTGSLGSGTLRASTLSSTTASINGRAITLARWGRPYLGTFPNNASAPYWVVVTRGGPTNTLGISPLFNSTTGNTLNNRTNTNPNCAIGRIAYAVYDQGGLLDITVAGHPSTLSIATNNLIKGTVAGADLSVVGISPDTLIQWRNQASASSDPSYVSYIMGYASTNGFRKVAKGDTTFLSRQDLIKAAGTAGISTALLTNLTTFTREKNAPSWGPSTNAVDLGGSNGAGNIYAYRTQAFTSTSTNIYTPYIRYTTTASITRYHSNGTSEIYKAPPGSPLLSRRFPLDRLKWVTYAGPSAALSPSDPHYNPGGTAAAIQACFGLVWTSSSASVGSTPLGGSVWRYVGHNGTTAQTSIKTLTTVASEGREANFFELLQAGILTGSLGRSNNTTSPGNYMFDTAYQSSTMLQIMRIGACLIDEYDTDSYPTIIEFLFNSQATLSCGVESLPYLNVFNDVMGKSPDNAQSLATYYVFGLWNPMQGNIPEARPNVRLKIQGTTAVLSGFASTMPITISGFSLASPGVLNVIPPTSIMLSSGGNAGVNGFTTPSLIHLSDTATSPGSGTPAGLTWCVTPALSSTLGQCIGFRGQDLPLSLTITDPDPNGSNTNDTFKIALSSITANAADSFQAMLEFQSPSGWIPYNYFSGINSNSGTNRSWLNRGAPTQKLRTQVAQYGSTTLTQAMINTYAFGGAWDNFGHYPLFLTSDPRALRMGFFVFPRSENASFTAHRRSGVDPLWTSTMGDSTFRDSGYGGLNSAFSMPLQLQVQVIPQMTTSAVLNPTGIPYYPASFTRNRISPNGTGGTYNMTYTDQDNVTRMGDSGFFTQPLTSVLGGNPFERVADRPVILNRAFQSVAEMGYAFRDLPWRSLNFFSADSPDAGLLDLFCLTETPNNGIAGRVSLNSRNKLVLQSILAGVVTDPVSGSVALNKPDTVAQSLVNFTSPANASGGPLVNKSELATKFLASTTALPGSNFSGNDEEKIKARRESIVRALGDVGQTRTWNLLIDLVAQVGKYPPNATTLDQFMVEGEKRYWLHIAIDRITGEIVDQQLETVIE